MCNRFRNSCNCGGHWRTQAVWHELARQRVCVQCTDFCGNPLAGCTLTLESRNGTICAVSDERGFACFHNVCPGCYTLSAANAPAGFRANCRRHCLCVGENGGLRLNGRHNHCIRLCFEALPCRCRR
ncbi:MAG: hypothetical protein FWG82_05140 [Oscillospiraceae bacterium]|nr:hypothetical protein [Oscillospiraceae bacterium]